MSRKYKFNDKHGAYFVSFAAVHWIDVFTREIYFECIIESLDFCRKEKGMEIYGYVIMSNHIHFIFRSLLGNPSGLMRDFKGFTSKKLLKLIEGNPKESRKEWMLWIFERAGYRKSNVQYRQFWEQDNHPIELWTTKFFEQKLNYIHQNPVKAGFVTDSVDWKYSSARNYENDDHSVLEIDLS